MLTKGVAPSNTQAFLYFQIVQAPRIIRVFTPFLCSFFTLLIVLHHQSAKLLSFWQGTKSVSSNGWSNLNHIRLQWDSSRRITRTPWLLKYCIFCFYHSMLLLTIILPSLGRACLAELQLVSLAPKFCGASKLGVDQGYLGKPYHSTLDWNDLSHFIWAYKLQIQDGLESCQIALQSLYWARDCLTRNLIFL